MNYLRIITLVLLLITPNLFTSCGKYQDEITQAIAVVQDGIRTIERESTSWRGTLEDIYDDLPETSNEIITDARLQVDQLLDEGIANVFTNIQCIIDEVPGRSIKGLHKVLAELRSQPVLASEECAKTCSTSTSEVDLSLPTQYQKIILNGFDYLDAQYDLYLIVVEPTGFEQALSSNYIFVQSNNKMTIYYDGLGGILQNYDRLKVMCNNTLISEFRIIN